MSDEIHIGSIKQRLTGNRCPACGRPADGGTALDDKEAARMPKCGDYAVCLYCGELNRYDAALMLRTPNAGEVAMLRRDPRLSRLLKLASDTARDHRRKWQ